MRKEDFRVRRLRSKGPEAGGEGGAREGPACREGFPLACLRHAFGTLLHLTTPLAPFYFVLRLVVRVFAFCPCKVIRLVPGAGILKMPKAVLSVLCKVARDK